MTITNVGFNGQVSAVQWGANAPLLMAEAPMLGALGDCKISQVSSVRAVDIGVGGIGADGVASRVTATERVTLPTITNGQWFLLVLRRVWGTSTSTFELRNAATTSTSAAGLPPTSYPASLKVNPGNDADAPVAWLWGNSSSTNVVVVPLIFPSLVKVPRMGTAAQRDAYYSGFTAGNTSAQIALQGNTWINTDTNGILERYVGPYHATYNPYGIDSNYVGWYGNESQMSIWMRSSGTSVIVPNNTSTVISLGVDERRKGFAVPTSSGLRVTRQGRYLASISGLMEANNTTTGFRRLGLVVNNDAYLNPILSAEQNGERSTDTNTNLSATGEISLAYGDVLQLVAVQNTGASINFVRNHPRTWVGLRYLGPDIV